MVPFEPLRLRDAERQRPMSPAETHILWARLRDWGSEAGRAKAAADLATAQKLSPEFVDAQAWQARLELAGRQLDKAIARLTPVVDAHPQDAELAALLGEALLARERARPSAQRDLEPVAKLAASAEAPDATPSVLRFAAHLAAARGELARAIAFTDRAIARQPDCAVCFEDLSWLRAYEGRLQAALDAEEMAARLFSDGLPTGRIAARLKELRQKLREGP
jgi:tetratricopeptide (TPR) repeat protein